MQRRLLQVILAAALLTTVQGCGNDEERTAAAEAVAADLARALSKTELAGIPIDPAAQDELETIVAGIGNVPVDVTTEQLTLDGDTATAELTWRWQTAGSPWEYRTTAGLRWADDQWSVQWSPELVEPSLAAGEELGVTTRQAERQDILGSAGARLVTQRPVVRFGIDKSRVDRGQAGVSARALARLVGIAPGDYAERVATAGAKAFVPAVVLRRAAARKVNEAELDAIPGASAIADELPLAPTRGFAGPLLGHVGQATADVVAESEGAVQADDVVGLSGLQSRYDDQLGGTPGVTVTAGAGEAQRTLVETEPVAGDPLRTTLDRRLQRRVEAALAGTGPASAVVVVQPSTGHVLAAASGPGSGGYNTATIGQYAPGSTMKVVTALALMRAGVGPQDRVPCTRRVIVDGKTFTNYDAYPSSGLGRIALTDAVANSCNTALISQYRKVKGTDLGAAAAALGLGVDQDLGFPAYFGQVPRAESATGRAAALIGQGTVLASPLAMAAVAASVAQGEAVVPLLLPDHGVELEAPAQPLSREEAAALRDMMRAVVSRGTSTFLRDLPGPPVGAKTGTAEFGSANPPDTHAWMIAYQGDLAVAAFVARGESGSSTAGPILEQVLRDSR